MIDEQEDHLLNIKRTFDILVDNKYRRGQLEHGGNLWLNSEEHLLDCAIDEAIDQVVYLFTLKDKLMKKLISPM